MEWISFWENITVNKGKRNKGEKQKLLQCHDCYYLWQQYIFSWVILILFYFHSPCVCLCISTAQLSVLWTDRTSSGRNYRRAQIHQSRVTLKRFQTKCQVWTNNVVRLSSIERQMLKLPRDEIKAIVHPK